jgi:hypothetical protein
MLDLQPLIARLVEDILRVIAEATRAELEVIEEQAGAARVRTAAVHRGRVRRPKGARVQKASVPVGLKARARGARGGATRDSTTPEPLGVDDITDPEQLLMPMPRGLSTDQTPAPPGTVESKPGSEREEEAPSSRGQDVGHHRTLLRAGESVARASAAGVVIRRAKRG